MNARVVAGLLLVLLSVSGCCVSRPDGPGLSHLQPLPDDAAYWREAASSNKQIGICGLVWCRPDWHLVVRVHWPRIAMLIPVSDEPAWYTIPASRLVITGPDGTPIPSAPSKRGCPKPPWPHRNAIFLTFGMAFDMCPVGCASPPPGSKCASGIRERRKALAG